MQPLQVLHLGLGNVVHGLNGYFTERVTFVDKVQLVVIDSNVVEIIRDDVNRKSIETLLVIKDRDVNRFGLCGDSVVNDSIDDEAVVPDVLPLPGPDIAVGQVGVDLLVVILVDQFL